MIGGDSGSEKGAGAGDEVRRWLAMRSSPALRKRYGVEGGLTRLPITFLQRTNWRLLRSSKAPYPREEGWG
jgi:hypothetical protein